MSLPSSLSGSSSAESTSTSGTDSSFVWDIIWEQLTAVFECFEPRDKQFGQHITVYIARIAWDGAPLSTPCSQVPEISKAIPWRGVKWTTWETSSSVSPYWSKLPANHRTNQGLSQRLQLQTCHFPLYPWRRPSDKGSKKQVQAENANALRKSSDSEKDRLQDIQEEPRRRIGPSRVKELAKFFTPTSDEEENSQVNNRTRRKKLFEPKKEEGSEKWQCNLTLKL